MNDIANYSMAHNRFVKKEKKKKKEEFLLLRTFFRK